MFRSSGDRTAAGSGRSSPRIARPRARRDRDRRVRASAAHVRSSTPCGDLYDGRACSIGCHASRDAGSNAPLASTRTAGGYTTRSPRRPRAQSSNQMKTISKDFRDPTSSVSTPARPRAASARKRHSAATVGAPTGQMCTTGQVRVRAIPFTSWMRETTILPRASMLAASTTAITS